MAESSTPPASAEELRAAILQRYESLSKRLQQIARYVLDEPNAVALETLAVLSERTGVQPSAIVRFAKSFGFDGATQMQRLFRDGLLSGNASLAYGERVREFSEAVDGKAVGDPGQVLAEFVEGNVLALQNLGKIVARDDLARAVKLIARADTVYVAGVRRSFPVAAYLAYSLQQVDKKTVFIDSVGGMSLQQAHAITADDLLIAVSYHPYAAETVQLVDAAVERRCKVLSISDSLVSPVAKPATQVLQVREAEIRKFRSLSASMCLAQVLVIAYAFAVTPVAATKRRKK
ncbi:MurR/RpiR family transcriptional regulator [Pseudoxanthomonas wuyuanensis]|uniref:Transcriptional regulator, RpiR family n=1 Tax=Pseudoxanthomonas wuyuanensis TaxID=1073196 RepID=A0A286D6K8_9GAMM|nr:MurR/RpiR family transcriptional regulator [Pseudoxanthomonas wuyuanensis]KAF1721448.1 MurR/RpiR family transcriptional regulator [Pseudoxanthomonas wuyuanensis]SOD54295.1 transcriptional regulator, RpiR family [Pseudoxanthomonas wuyuanensis]